jgi:hypothetical protein
LSHEVTKSTQRGLAALSHNQSKLSTVSSVGPV